MLNKSSIIIGFLLFILSMLVQSETLSGQKLHVVKETIDIGELPSGRPSRVSLWYPDTPCNLSREGRLCLDVSAVTDRTIVLSHGAMGAADNYQWLGEALAGAGYIVVGVNHFGESWFYGADTQNITAAAMLWQRPEDISAIYNVLSNRNLFQKPVNWSNIIAIGHSSGGQTVAMLAGAQFDLNQIINFCNSAESAGDHSCDYGQRNSAAPGKMFFEKMQASYRDARVKKIVLLDPTLGYGATSDSLSKIALPTLIVGAKNNDFLPWANHSARYVAGITNAQSFWLEGKEGHFVFLDSCKEDIAVMGVSLCRDLEGVDRARIHEILQKNIINFVQENNISIDLPASVKIQKNSFHLSNLVMFLAYTPVWVWGLLAFLVFMGVLQSRDRYVPLSAAYSIPVIMLGLSLSSIIMNFGITLLAILSWIFGVALVQVFALKSSRAASVEWKPEEKKFWVLGSWWPLVIFVGIFAMRYALGAGKAMQANFLHSPEWILGFSLLSGLFSGFFLSRIWFYIKAKKIGLASHSALV